ncbi:MAG: DUF4249 family protein [Bacteroidetes bacterium]|nr:DUF4249 family protein [Bacteroidota bacterium]
MKRLVAVILLLFFFIYSCDEPFSIVGTYESRYVLTCVIEDSKDVQFAYLTRSYEVGSSKEDNLLKNGIKNAQIELIENEMHYFFKDTTIVHANPTGNDSVDCYVLNGYYPQSNAELNLIATLPNGEVLTSSTKTFPENYCDFKEFKSSIPGEYWLEGYGFELDFGDSTEVYNDFQYYPTLNIYYTKKREGDSVRYVKEIPNSLTEVNGKIIDHYPQSVPVPMVNYGIQALTKGLLDICEEGFEPEEYKIVLTEFVIYLPDQNLSKYFIANRVFESSINVLVEKPFYSNIEGGIGLFASITKTVKRCWFKSEYLDYLGFRSIY